jgi:hypothetical protein
MVPYDLMAVKTSWLAEGNLIKWEYHVQLRAMVSGIPAATSINVNSMPTIASPVSFSNALHAHLLREQVQPKG